MSRSRSNRRLLVAMVLVPLIGASALAVPGSADAGDPGEPLVVEDAMWPDQTGVSVSPDGDWVVFLPDGDGDGPQELAAQPIGGGDWSRLSLDQAPDGGADLQDSILRYVITDDGLVVQTSQDLENAGPIRLATVPIAGGFRDILDTDLGGPRLELSGDHSHVVYLGAASVLHSIALPGGTPVDLGITVVSGTQGSVLVPVGDDRFIVWGREAGTSLGRLWLVPVAGGGPPTALTAAAPAERVPRSVIVAGDRVVYIADHATANVRELWSAPLSGAGAVRLSRAMPTGGDVKDLVVTTDGGHVVFRADQRTNNVNELWRVAVDGGPNLRLSRKLVTGGDVKPGFAISDDGSVVVYRADARTNNQRELFGTDIDGADHWRFNKQLPAGGDVSETAIVGDTVVFRADQRVNNVKELFAIPLRDGALTVLSGSLEPNVDVRGRGTSWDFVASPDSSLVLYSTRISATDEDAIHLVPITGGQPVRMNDPALDDVGRFWFSPDSAWVGWDSFDEAHRARTD